jgi:hypothetical protein
MKQKPRAVEETRSGFTPIDNPDRLPAQRPPKPSDSLRSARPPAFIKDLQKKRD